MRTMTFGRFLTKNRVLMLACTLAMLGVGQAQAGGPQAGFSEQSIKGCYVEALAGTVLPNPTDPTLQLPIATLVRFCADGVGNATVSGTQNIAGSCIIEQVGSATYTVEPKGTGVVSALLEATAVSPGCASLTPPTEVGDKVSFTLRFAIERRGGCLQTIGIGLDPEGFAPPIGYVAEGEACPQRGLPWWLEF